MYLKQSICMGHSPIQIGGQYQHRYVHNQTSTRNPKHAITQKLLF